MKAALLFASLLMTVLPSAFAKILYKDGKLFIEAKGKQNPLAMVNELIAQKKLEDNITLYGEGRVHAISFTKRNEKELLYSVDEKGFVYALEPFATYKIKKVDPKGFIYFNEVPTKKYKVTDKGFFIF